jgi:chromosome segregation ATPase
MKRSVIFHLMLGALCLGGAQAIPAADSPPTVETQLRERLRDTVLQLRAAETERAALQAAQAQSADEKKALTAQLVAITKEANANKLAAKVADSLNDSLKSQVTRQDKEMAQLKEAIENCRQEAELVRNKEMERAKRQDEVVIDLERLVADRQAKNLALYKIASEILQRYQQFGLGDALTAREPFVGVTRVKLQNLVQDYQDKIQNERTTLEKKDLEFDQNKPMNQPPQTSTSSATPPAETPE